MNPVDSELHHLEDLCDALETRLEKQHRHASAGFPPDPVEERKAARIEEQVVEAEEHIARLAQTHGTDSGAPAPDRSEIASRAAALKLRTQHILKLIERNIAQFRRLRGTAQGSLQELQLGAQYLQSVHGNREKQPKFIDARQ